MLARLNLVALALIALVALPGAGSAAMAGQATIGGLSINLPPPEGFCELTDRNPADKGMITKIGEVVGKGGNRLLNMSADCGQLADWRAQKRLLDDFAEYQTPVGSMNTTLAGAPAELIKQNCAVLRTQGDKIAADISPDVKSHVEQVFDKARLNEVAFVGVLAEDTTACYAGAITKIKTDDGTIKTQLFVFAITVVKGKYVFVYRFAVYLNSDMVDGVLAKVEANVAALLAANRS
jgi:hypothetical protein